MIASHPLRISTRLLFLTGGIALPLLGIILWLLVRGIQPNITFAEQELRGNRYQRPLLRLLEALPRLPGDTGPDRSAVVSEIDAAFQDLASAQVELGAALGVTPEEFRRRQRQVLAPTDLLARWQTVRAAADPSGSRHELLREVRALLSYTGDTSNLILDPDLDSYYLMDVTLLGVPQFLETSQSLAGATEATERAIQAAVLTRIDGPRIAASLRTAFSEDAGFHGASPTLQSLAPRLQEFETALKALDLAAPWAVRRSGLALGLAASAELDRLLAARIAHYRHQLRLSLAATAGVFLLAALFGYTIRRSIVQTLTALSGQMHQAAITAEGHAGAMLSISESIAKAACENAAALQEAHATTHQFVGATEANLRSIEDAATTSRRTREICAAGVEGTRRLHEEISGLKTDSDTVHTILKDIDEIAFQTNILALNAAVEAARAGEAGAGFAVVANEVRALAQRSATSARDTNDRLGAILRRTAVGAQLTDRLRTQIEEIFAATKRVDDVAVTVAASCREQSHKVRQMGSSLEILDRQTQAFAARAEEAAASSAEVSQQAHQLQGAVNQLSAFVDGEQPAAAKPAVPPAPPAGDQARPAARREAPVLAA